MLFQRETRRLLGVLLFMFAGIALAAGYWAVNGALSLLQRQDNPRLVEAESAVRRGSIFDSAGVELVRSLPISDDVGAPVQRFYLEPAAYSALGYYSLRYGEIGIEAAYDSLLSGGTQERDASQVLTDTLLHLPRHGGDVMLTLDSEVQRRLAERLDGLAGAGVVIDVPSGDILALVSLPTYDPNTLDTEWDRLIETPGDPFFNRVVQGRYQPGSALQTPLMAAASLVGYPLDTTFANAAAPYSLDNIDLRCAVRLPEIEFTLTDAYAFACPSPFAQLADALGGAVIEATFDTFRLQEYPTLPGYEQIDPTVTVQPTPTTAPLTTNIAEAALGQGEVVVSPLMMALISAGIVNDGNAPQPNLLMATRAYSEAGSSQWVDQVTTLPSFPIATANTAGRLQDLMRDAVANGAAQNAGRPDIDIGGHASLAYAGDETHVWFIGFATLGSGRAIATAIVVEQNADPGLAADIGGDVLAVAHDRLSP